MKRLYTFCLLLAALLMPWMASADSVNQEQALAKAVQFFQQHPQTRTAPGFELIWDGESAATRATAEPAFFIFNRTDAPGFVIIAGDDSVSPVIGYSFENGFGKGEMPSNLRYWLEGVRGAILLARETGAPVVNQTPRLGNTVKQLETADWDQGAPYNRECPTYGDQQALTGCIATAAAIVCQYNRWPDQGNGSTAAYMTETRHISMAARKLGSYNYDLMPNTYVPGQYSEEQANEVARLMADIGAGVKADYARQDGTAATALQQLSCMTTYMRYSKEARLLFRAGYEDDQWAEMLRAEIDANRPVLYSAASSSGAGGHAFVLDGYTSDGMFCFNWGWSGSANGAYEIRGMAPAGSGYSFNAYHEAIFGLVPDKEGTTSYSDNLVIHPYDGIGLSTADKVFVTGTPFRVNLWIANVGFLLYDGKVNMALFDKNHTMKEVISTESNVQLSGSMDGAFYLSNHVFTCTVTTLLKPGDYVAPIFWEHKSKQWMRMRAYSDGTVDHIVVLAANPNGDDIAEQTTVAWDRKTRLLTLGTINGATLELLKPDGSVLISQPVGNEAIVLKDLASGSYTVRIYFDADEPCKFTLTL